MDRYFLSGDEPRVAGERAEMITYNFWQGKLCSVKIAWFVDASRRASIGQHLMRDWGPPETTSLRVPSGRVDPDFPEWLSKDGRTFADLASIDFSNDRDYPGRSRPVQTEHLWTLLIEERRCSKEARGG
jgi:hypothetical protein